MTEHDGLRVVSNDSTYFLSIVQEATVEVFGVESKNASAAKLHEAQKLMDLKNPKADEILMSLGVNLNDGIQRILEASKYESFELDVLKNLL
jgi:hypothetical protein